MEFEKRFINCPECKSKIEITEALTNEIENQVKQKYSKDFQTKAATFKAEFEQKERTLQASLSKQKEELILKAKKEAETAVNAKIGEIETQLKSALKRAEDSEKHEVELRNKVREVEQKEKNIDLTIARKVDEEKQKIYTEAKSKFEEESRFKVEDKDKQISDLKKQLDDMKRKLDQSSQQLQGEVMELEVQKMLEEAFDFDEIQEIKKGANGADILQEVKTQSGRPCGKILWETKRAKSWNDDWIEKLKEDQLNAKADIAVIVSNTPPKGLRHYRELNGVWIADYNFVVSLAIALRHGLINLSCLRQALMGKNENSDRLYEYVTGNEFKNRVIAIVEAFSNLQEELHREQRAMKKIWAEREKQIQKAIYNTAAMYGDFKGVVGGSLPTVQLLELPYSDSEGNGETQISTE